MSGKQPSAIVLSPAQFNRTPHREGRLCECGAHAFAPLTRGYVTLVSPQDIGVFERKWTVKLHRRHAVATRIVLPQRRAQYLHRLIAQASRGEVVDHANGDPLDNRRENLRIADLSQNSWNRVAQHSKRSGLPKGVFRQGERYRAHITARGIGYSLGVFDTALAAAEAYSEAAKVLHGEFARAA
jgi:hypothetical protein